MDGISHDVKNNENNAELFFFSELRNEQAVPPSLFESFQRCSLMSSEAESVDKQALPPV